MEFLGDEGWMRWILINSNGALRDATLFSTKINFLDNLACKVIRKDKTYVVPASIPERHTEARKGTVGVSKEMWRERG